MELWDAVKKPPESVLKTINGGRLKGFTDINPVWRVMAMTEIYGPCGIGWKFTIDKQWSEKGFDNQVFAFTNVSLYIKCESKWSEAIPGNGGSMLIANEKAGPYCSDEAYKMATTDALGTAMKMLGVAADVYMGVSETKYQTQNNYSKTPKTAIACPECKKTTSVTVGKKEYGGGMVCWIKKEGCGHKWKTWEQMAQELKLLASDEDTWVKVKKYIANEWPGEPLSETITKNFETIKKIVNDGGFDLPPDFGGNNE